MPAHEYGSVNSLRGYPNV